MKKTQLKIAMDEELHKVLNLKAQSQNCSMAQVVRSTLLEQLSPQRLKVPDIFLQEALKVLNSPPPGIYARLLYASLKEGSDVFSVHRVDGHDKIYSEEVIGPAAKSHYLRDKPPTQITVTGRDLARKLYSLLGSYKGKELHEDRSIYLNDLLQKRFLVWDDPDRMTISASIPTVERLSRMEASLEAKGAPRLSTGRYLCILPPGMYNEVHGTSSWSGDTVTSCGSVTPDGKLEIYLSPSQDKNIILMFGPGALGYSGSEMDIRVTTDQLVPGVAVLNWSIIEGVSILDTSRRTVGHVIP